ncbi:tyrosine-type recombinase/integrase [Aeromonas allosaccharophila]|uniref:tyrosine-type recombinase/integrase n=1 Tax=Aeromonas allosaccharophila TaxID=656 RepID=UPI003D20C5B4
MNLWLSPHGIWYYRKVTTLPCGRRKEIKKSLHTRDKLTARHKVTQLLACVRSRPKPIQLPADATVDPHEQSVSQPMTPAAKPRAQLLSVLSDRYQKEKAFSWAPKERKNQKNYLGSFIEALGDKPAAGYSKADVVKFKEGLLNSGKSPATINKYLQKLSLLFNWLANHQEGIVNHFAGLKLQRVKETKARSGYTMEERQRFVQWAKRQEPYRRWIALLGLYTGARANEICQLYADDVVLVDNIWCIKVQG